MEYHKKTSSSRVRQLLCLLTAGCLAAPLASCVSDDDGASRDAGNITFTLDGKAPATRGTVITTATLTSFGVSGALYPSSESYAANTVGNYFYMIQAQPGVPTAYGWPKKDYRAAFYAYYPYGNAALTMSTAASGSPLPTYAYTVPQAVASQVDVMTTEATDVSCAAQAAVPLTFRHRLTDIRITAHNRKHSAITLKTVTLSGVKYAGTLTGETWTPTGSANSTSVYPFTITVNASMASQADRDVTGTTLHLMMIPQVVPAGTLTFTVTTTEGGVAKEYSFTFDDAVTFEMGKSYLFTLNVGDVLVVSPLTDVTDWEYVEWADPDPTASDWDGIDPVSPNNTITDPDAQPVISGGSTITMQPWQ